MTPSKSCTPCTPVAWSTRCMAIVHLVLMLALSFAAAGPSRADTCGADGERPCGLTERIPSCDLNLSEGGGRCYRAACGAEGQRGCGPTERVMFDFLLQLPVPKACDANLVADILKNQCVHPACGREGQRACTIPERLPSCDVNLFESSGRCLRPGNCGRAGQPPCDLTVRGPLFRCDANLVGRNGVCMRPGSVDTQTAATGGTSPAPAPAPVPAAALPPPPRPAPPPPPPAAAPPAPTQAAGSLEIDTDRPGSDLHGFNVAQANPAMCQSSCTNDAQCVAWTYVKPGIQGPAPRCYLKNAVPASTRNACCVSGAKASSPLVRSLR